MKIGSLFSGAGGLDLAVEAHTGGTTVWQCEQDPHASLVLAERFGAPNLGDITAVDWTDVEPVDVLCGGFPCQDISNAGKRAGITGARSGLWSFYADAVRILRPRHVCVENVGALVVRGLDTVVGDLAALGYDATWGCVRASDAGAPHRRERLFLVASDTEDDGHERPRTARHGWDGSADGGHVASDADGSRREGHGRPVRGAGELAAAARRVEPLGDVKLLPTPTAMEPGGTPEQYHARLTRARGGGEPTFMPLSMVTDWGEYAAAIARWEPIIGRPAPAPVDDAGRLSAHFVEWMMGWPEGWVTGLDLARTHQLRILGNGVCPQQAELAFALLAEMEVAA